jgi:hypothetical protein
MPDDSPARNIIAPPPLAGADYDAIFATIAATERGRWFLDEYALRHRGADTELVLAAVRRVETAVNTSPARAEPPPAADALRQDFAAAAQAIGRARHAVGYGAGATTDASETLRGLIDEIDWRLHNLAEALHVADAMIPVEPPPAETAAAEPVAPPPTAPAPVEQAFVEPPADVGLTPVEETGAEAVVTDWAFDNEPPPELPDDARLPPVELGRTAEQAPEPSVANDLIAEPPPVSEPPATAADDPMERLEAREYGRHNDFVLQQDMQEPPPLQSSLRIDDVVGEPERLDLSPIRNALDDLVMGGTSATAATSVAHTPEPDPEPWLEPIPPLESLSSPPAIDLTADDPPPAEAASFGDPMLESELFGGDRQASPADMPEELPMGLADLAAADTLGPRETVSDDFLQGLTEDTEPVPPPAAAAPSPPETPPRPAPPAMPPAATLAMPPAPNLTMPPAVPTRTSMFSTPTVTAKDGEPKSGDPKAEDQDAVLQRLETMRKSIASLMDEIAVKTGRPVEPPPRR